MYDKVCLKFIIESYLMADTQEKCIPPIQGSLPRIEVNNECDNYDIEEFQDEIEEQWMENTDFSRDETPRVKEIDPSLLEEEERNLAGDIVPVEFTLPNKETVNHNFVMGQTVAAMKAYLEDMFELPYELIVLHIGNIELIDPLSLNDIPAFMAHSINKVIVSLIDS